MTPFRGRPALFVDRDGVIIIDQGYAPAPDAVTLIEGAAALVARANRAGEAVITVTNQSGIGRGFSSWDDFVAVQTRMYALLAAQGAVIDAVLACAFQADALPPFAHPDHPWRKPNGGMIDHAVRTYGLDAARSRIIGDRASDLAAGAAAGLRAGVLLGDGALPMLAVPGYTMARTAHLDAL